MKPISDIGIGIVRDLADPKFDANGFFNNYARPQAELVLPHLPKGLVSAPVHRVSFDVATGFDLGAIYEGNVFPAKLRAGARLLVTRLRNKSLSASYGYVGTQGNELVGCFSDITAPGMCNSFKYRFLAPMERLCALRRWGTEKDGAISYNRDFAGDPVSMPPEVSGPFLFFLSGIVVEFAPHGLKTPAIEVSH